ncbi:hypothetical protein AAFN60_05890 [Roseibacillus persicicus]|uniref:hypothetical protein n=1 Tax=Roseibacillus persicicus TaxID=454148 RepID=UPI00398B3778
MQLGYQASLQAPAFLATEQEERADGRIKDVSALQDAILAAQERWGEGPELRDAIINLFRDCDVPLLELMSFLESSTDQTVIGHAFTGITLRFNDPSLQSLADAGDISSLIHASYHGKNFGDVLNIYINSAEKEEERLARLQEAFTVLEQADFNSNPRLVPPLLRNLARNFSAKETPELLDQLIQGKFKLLENAEFQQTVLEALSNGSAVTALDHLAGYSEIADEAKWSLAHGALEFSQASLKNYVEDHPGDLVAKAVYAKKLLQQGFPETLRHLLHEEGFEESSAYGRRLGGQLWSHDARIVGAEARKNPEKVVRDFARGTSQFETCHLVTAVNEWMKADGEAAAQWVENEGINLPPEDRQFVAISYAREAAKQGEFDLAHQWADLILDEERKARVMREIASKQ